MWTQNTVHNSISTQQLKKNSGAKKKTLTKLTRIDSNYNPPLMNEKKGPGFPWCRDIISLSLSLDAYRVDPNEPDGKKGLSLINKNV